MCSWQEKRRTWCQIKDMVMLGMSNAKVLVPFYELLTGTRAACAATRMSAAVAGACMRMWLTPGVCVRAQPPRATFWTGTSRARC